MTTRTLLILSLFICILSLSGCKNDNISKQINTITPDLSGNTHFKLSEIFNDIKYIPLETKDSCLVGQIQKVISIDSFIFVLDASNSKALFLFRNNGRFIRKIGTSGRGPGEYKEPFDFDIDRENKQIIVLDPEQRLFIFYNYKGKHIKSVKINFLCLSFSYKNKQFYCWKYKVNPDGSDSHLIVLNEKGTITTQQDNFSPIKNMGILKAFHKTDKELYYSPSFRDTIYKVKQNNSLVPDYYIDFKSKGLSSVKETNKLTANDLPNYSYKLNFGINSQYIWFNIFNKEEKIYCFYNKTTNTSYSGKAINDIDNIPFFPSVTDEYSLTGWINAFEFLDLAKKDNTHPHFNKELKQSDNPIIIKFMPK